MTRGIHPIRRVLIIGGGPCGLVSLRNLLDRAQFDDVQLVERRDNIGGVCPWESPAYPGLIGNVLPEFLSFSGQPFPPLSRPGQPFPTLRETYGYLETFARPLFERGRIRLGHEVTRVEEVGGAADEGGWRVVMTDWTAGGEGVRKEERWDAVVITTVWFDNAYYPNVEGLDEIKETGRVRHAKTWRDSSGYEGKRVMVIGNANSANEMAAQLTPVAQLPVYRSARRVSIFPSLPDDRIEDVGPVVRYTSTGEKITAHLQHRTIEDVDYVLFGTGYYPDVPYLRVLEPGSLGRAERSARKLVPLTSRSIQPSRIPSLYRQVLYAYNPSLAFTGALVSFIPFMMADLTSTWLALVWSGHIEIPSAIEDRLDDERVRLKNLHQLRSETDNPSDLVSFHFLGCYELPYAKDARADVVRAMPEMEDVLAKWDEEQDSRRFAMYATKLDSLYTLVGKKESEI
ncbi:FAD/NAD(P)-binding domain-containing protein [Gyrodon lividus]|nr:FAD/NAD(P)-binding domain-containing protein [Gyrodon lividus]